MNPAADADADAILDEEREPAKLRVRCTACDVAFSVRVDERGKLDRLANAHLNTAGERYGTPCSEETLIRETVYTDGSTEAL